MKDLTPKPLRQFGIFGNLGPLSFAGPSVGNSIVPKKPVVAPVMPMPDPDAIAAAKKRATIQAANQTGRDSTILTSSTDKLGG